MECYGIMILSISPSTETRCVMTVAGIFTSRIESCFESARTRRFIKWHRINGTSSKPIFGASLRRTNNSTQNGFQSLISVGKQKMLLVKTRRPISHKATSCLLCRTKKFVASTSCSKVTSICSSVSLPPPSNDCQLT
jgi:hypothetical protein